MYDTSDELHNMSESALEQKTKLHEEQILDSVYMCGATIKSERCEDREIINVKQEFNNSLVKEELEIDYREDMKEENYFVSAGDMSIVKNEELRSLTKEEIIIEDKKDIITFINQEHKPMLRVEDVNIAETNTIKHLAEPANDPNSGTNESKSIKKYGSIYACNKCGKAWKSRSRQHQCIENTSGIYTCSFCQQTYKIKHEYFSHFNSFCRRFFCKICDNSFMNETILSYHMRLHTSFSCKYCNQLVELVVFNGTIPLKSILHMCKSVYCNGSEQIFNTVQVSQNNIKYSVVYICNMCDKSFSNKKNYTKHILIHEEKLICKPCNKSFSRKSNYNKHILMHKEKLTCNVKHICEVCDKSFFWKDYKKHVLMHKGRFNCNICNKPFCIKASYNKHILMHKEKYICNLCNETFIQKKYLTRHKLEYHTSLKHVCEVCTKAFTYKWKLDCHLLTHKKETNVKVKLNKIK